MSGTGCALSFSGRDAQSAQDLTAGVLTLRDRAAEMR
jgi:hypothetical protein